MALHIPSHPTSSSMGSSGFHSAAPREWRDSHIRETLEHMEAGRLGNYKPHQIEGIRDILTKAAGADRNLSPTQTRAAIHEIGEKRLDLGLDRHEAEHLMDHLANGPHE